MNKWRVYDEAKSKDEVGAIMDKMAKDPDIQRELKDMDIPINWRWHADNNGCLRASTDYDMKIYEGDISFPDSVDTWYNWTVYECYQGGERGSIGDGYSPTLDEAKQAARNACQVYIRQLRREW